MKKTGLLKILHKKYVCGTGKTKTAAEVVEFQALVKELAQENRELQPYISNAQETLNPLKVLYLFRRIPDAVSAMYMMMVSYSTLE